MKWYSEKSRLRAFTSRGGFTLVEAATAVIILGLFCSGILVVVERCMNATIESVLRMHAFEVARENMEELLTADSTKETVEYGISEKYPEIKWQTTVETFSEPAGSKMWVRAVCSASYLDANGQEQQVEFVHWLTGLNEKQAALIEEQRQLLAELGLEQLNKQDQPAAADESGRPAEPAESPGGPERERSAQPDWLKDIPEEFRPMFEPFLKQYQQ